MFSVQDHECKAKCFLFIHKKFIVIEFGIQMTTSRHTPGQKNYYTLIELQASSISHMFNITNNSFIYIHVESSELSTSLLDNLKHEHSVAFTLHFLGQKFSWTWYYLDSSLYPIEIY